MQTFKKPNFAKLGIDWTSAPLSYSQTFCAAKTSGSTTGVYLYTTHACGSFKHCKTSRWWRPTHAPWSNMSACLWNRTC